jgi:hypothetical protein
MADLTKKIADVTDPPEVVDRLEERIRYIMDNVGDKEDPSKYLKLAGGHMLSDIRRLRELLQAK